MFPRSRRIVVTLAATAALAGGAVAHAATGSSGSAADPATAPAAVVADDYAAADHAHGRLPEHGRRRVDAVDHSVDDPLDDAFQRLEHVVHVHDERVARPVPAPSPCRHVPTARRGSSSPPPASRAVRVVVLLAALALLAAGCGGAGGGATTTSGRVEIGQGLTGPAGLEATLYADRPAARLGVRARCARTAVGDDVGRVGSRKRRRLLVARAGARPVKVIAGVEGPARAGLASPARLYVASLGRVDVVQRPARRRASRTQPVIVASRRGHGWNNAIVALPDGRLVMGISSACDHCAPRRSGRRRSSRSGPTAATCASYARGIRAPFGLAYCPADRRAARQHEPARRPRRADAGRLARARPRGPGLALPGLLRAGRHRLRAACRRRSRVLDKHAAAGGVAIVAGQLGAPVGTLGARHGVGAGQGAARAAARASGAATGARGDRAR